MAMAFWYILPTVKENKGLAASLKICFYLVNVKFAFYCRRFVDLKNVLKYLSHGNTYALRKRIRISSLLEPRDCRGHMLAPRPACGWSHWLPSVPRAFTRLLAGEQEDNLLLPSEMGMLTPTFQGCLENRGYRYSAWCAWYPVSLITPVTTD